jgi:hypothetical protein
MVLAGFGVPLPRATILDVNLVAPDFSWRVEFSLRYHALGLTAPAPPYPEPK